MMPENEKGLPREAASSPTPSLHLAIVAALEALEVGDQGLAVAVLLGALEDGQTERRYRCECGASFEWPGLLDAHLLAAHEIEEAA